MIGAIAAHYVDGPPATPVDATLTVPAGKVASTQTNFVTRVDLAHMPAAWWVDVASDGGNVRVKQAGTVVPFDLVSINTAAKTGEVFIKATLNSATANVFTIDKSGAALLAATDPNGRNAVWSDYDDVFAFAGGLLNRTGSGNDATLVGTATIGSDGWLDCGAATGAAVATNLTRRTTWTLGVSAIRSAADTSTTSNRTILTYTDLGSADDARRATLSNDNATRPGLWNSTNSWLYGAAPGFWASGARHRVNCYHDAVTPLRGLSINGAAPTTSASAAARPGGTSATTLYIGQEDGTAGGRFYGKLNYVYKRNGVLAADWLSAESASWETPASFYTVA